MIFVYYIYSLNMCFIPVNFLPAAFAVQSTPLRTASTAVNWATALVIALNHVRRLKFVMLREAEDQILMHYIHFKTCSFKMRASSRPVLATQEKGKGRGKGYKNREEQQCRGS